MRRALRVAFGVAALGWVVAVSTDSLPVVVFQWATLALFGVLLAWRVKDYLRPPSPQAKPQFYG